MIKISLNAHVLIDVIGELFSDETSLALSDANNYVYYRPSKRIDLKIQPGDPVVEGTITHKALKSKQKVSEYMDRDIFGVPYYGMAVPYQAGGEIAGCVTAIFPTLTNALSVITVKGNDEWIPIKYEHVLYIEAKARKTFVVGESHTGTHKYSLNEFDFLLPASSFIRCHRSFIVNINHIQAIYPDTHSTFLLKMNDDSMIPVSQSHSSYFRKLLGF
ncbi:LytTr DNA-binding domain-containing protein [Halobacillus karajensis]|uniref:LytTR family DNA-binding domain-containing protein n=1 Tax=Halobacillus karajensis TaxID=195088 RepID=UPI0008A753F8|nr:LytTR family DNA-binding domain-containing protein [Halobacillus karajensis]SEH42860.1 LytTr DNA-binding domain-containing protein [Halobacillus karajensis]